MIALGGGVGNGVGPAIEDEVSMAMQITECIRTALANWQVKGCFAMIGGWYSSVSLGDALLLQYVLVLMGVDIVAGLLQSIVFHEYSSYKFCRGIVKILTYMATIVLVMFLAGSVNTAWGANTHIQDVFMAYLVACEVLSIIRHMERLGMPVPTILKKLAFGVQHKAEHTIDTISGEDEGK